MNTEIVQNLVSISRILEDLLFNYRMIPSEKLKEIKGALDQSSKALENVAPDNQDVLSEALAESSEMLKNLTMHRLLPVHSVPNTIELLCKVSKILNESGINEWSFAAPEEYRTVMRLAHP